MRGFALLGTLVAPVLLLGGCSGFGNFLGDTFTLPGMKPNLPYGLSENTNRVKGGKPDEAPILPEPGNVWPGPPQALPTLTDVTRGADAEGGAAPAGPALHDGAGMSIGEQDAVRHGRDLGRDLGRDQGRDPGSDASQAARRSRPGKASAVQPIVIPNGDGTFTVIGPDGSVKTVNSPPPNPR